MNNQNNIQRLVVLGAGESGVGTALLAKAKGYDVFVSDFGKITDKYTSILAEAGLAFEEEQHTEALILNADVVVKSPGIPDAVPIVKKIVSKRIPVISEIEFAVKYTKASVVGITGSNGKTTTTMLTGHVLSSGMEGVTMAGNIGDSFAKAVLDDQTNTFVLELSSFQLDGVEDFCPKIAILTNLSPDHLDRYEYSYDKYIAAKFRLIKNQTHNDYFIYDADDKDIQNYLKKHKPKAQCFPFSLEKELEQGVFIKNNHIVISMNNEQDIIISESSLSLKGRHNTKNAMAAAMSARLIGIRKQTIRESLTNFQGVEHRLEMVLKINNVQYINDSKATNVNATYFALEAVKTPVVWIVGGVDKGNDYSELYKLVNEKVKAIICLGVDNSRIVASFENCVDTIVETQSMQEAVKIAYALGERNDTVLLSPCCASFDLFKNYEDRGDQFKTAVHKL
ncbi:UDP-N-acetylmuramoyl-L-alanine--D-glutamate ligase [Aquimarina agarilytica]|uniref:UDP-N-acetylmuramoyl-L-alanine--D-glutamate ligase n=1 Tax=Aquimarina agarilytica TaxID=1087449 RepID=UPI0002882D07|nr:UDP-N-acetylmuramoyl-L-alanine--D-glutamate ligase [Aquimarina agarilytica]